ncbi:MAG: 4-(cytidine 5'-diphospho)-2-C-methyl-D-erythritol kinase [Psittacicella sp.]
MNSKKLTLLSPAKINLFLYINNKRADGYHNIQTLFHFIELFDILTFEVDFKNESISIHSNFNNIISIENNIIYKAAKILKEKYCIKNGIKISLTKNIPFGAGLGGGSSNAATTLIALNKLWGINAAPNELKELGSILGADVNIFLDGRTSIANGIGNLFNPINIEEKYYVIVKPNTSISTKYIFQHNDLKRDSSVKNKQELLNSKYRNDFEPLIIKLYKDIKNTLNTLKTFDSNARLTGSGSCIFASFNSLKEANIAYNNLTNLKNLNIENCFIAKGMNTSPLLNFLKA